MPSWKSGCKFSLLAQPDSLARANTTGELQLEYENKSRVPLTAAVLSLHSSDSNVASPSPIPAGPIHVQARQGVSARRPYKGSSQIGNWSPVGPGIARLIAHVDVKDPVAWPLGTVDPDDDVQVN